MKNMHMIGSEQRPIYKEMTDRSTEVEQAVFRVFSVFRG